ncbi:MAG: hypothetical protein JWO43_157 [Candidatus Adlerbacteria bacterium]|nr:hypothetical protein [Candidatus Adlerbacteria bacterium]
MKFFMVRLNASRQIDGLPAMTMGRMGRVLQGIPTRDLYYLQSVCVQSKHFSKKFWWEIDPKKHQDVPFEDRAPKDFKKDWKKFPQKKYEKK